MTKSIAVQQLTNKQRRKSAGFTLIELMVVVTILGILASIAIPVYRDYTIKVRVSESAAIFSATKTAVTEYYSRTGNFPDSLVELSDFTFVSTDPFDYAGSYVSSLTVGVNGVVTVRLDNGTDLGSAASGDVIFSPANIGVILNWSVAGNGVDDKYLPILN
jgi:type IV pilus assembly protein PilA